MIEKEKILQTCDDLIVDTAIFLMRLIQFESTSGYEGPAMEWLYNQFKDISDECELIPVPEDIVDDPDFGFRIDDRPYEGRPNLRVTLKGDGTGKSVIFNAHIDVVPPSKGQLRPFDPYVDEGILYGRGACDDKGQVAVLWTIFKALKKLKIKPRGDIILHLVIEEETGGNGTLALVRRGERADCCINLEPCSNNILTSVRGAVWFTCTFYGRAGHSGSAKTTVSALDMAIEAINIIKDYHSKLLVRTINDDPLFAEYDNPMPVTFGQNEGGDWPAMAPQKQVFKGVFGFLTTPKEEVMHELVNRIRTKGTKWLKENFEMTFQYRHDTSRIDPNLPFVKTLAESYRTMRVKSKIGAMPASTDACYYTNILGIPALATGCGSLGDAHTDQEQLKLKSLIASAAVMTQFIKEWCGLRKV
ncbi:MAG: M20/M25/M40 family metallo-hydrolase [Candidatus Latescibacter sp.]|nr:M20/M25/M40 family metallo-hydrolase [Candidatus Latescibacter sp.]